MINSTNSSNVILVIDDSNIILAAKEAMKLTPRLVKIKLLNSNNVAASYLACGEYDIGLGYDNNVKNINEMLSHCSSVKISYSIRNTELYDVKIKKGEFIGIFEKRILISSRNMQQVCKKMIDRVVNDVKHPKQAYIFYNSIVKSEDLKFVRKYLNERHLLQVKIIFGNQNLYPFFIAVK